MPKTPKNSVPITRFGGVRVLQRRIQRSTVIEQNKEKIDDVGENSFKNWTILVKKV